MELRESKTRIDRIRFAFWILACISVALSIFLYVNSMPPPNGMYDAFAKCIANTSTTFYGAFWCPHCEAQKAEFGDAAKYLPYVECSLPDASGETNACKAAGITVYPTWVFPGGATSTGDQSLAAISAKTGCLLPGSK